MNDLMWWGYLHQNGTIQCKRWFGDHKDYTDDCEENPFVLIIVSPFKAETREDAINKIAKEIERKQAYAKEHE